ncbi:hypothetical protein C8Q77DRAFT_1150489 [Trametes polyzona]|nr:hypothetical protein C8Q77DRAFT_1150489 [Trametes polyzona]
MEWQFWHPTKATDRQLVVSEPGCRTDRGGYTLSHIRHLPTHPRQRQCSTPPISLYMTVKRAQDLCAVRVFWSLPNGRVVYYTWLSRLTASLELHSPSRVPSTSASPTHDQCLDSDSVPLLSPVPTKQCYTLYERRRSADQPVDAAADIRAVVPVRQYSPKRQLVSRLDSTLRTSNQARDIGGPRILASDVSNSSPSTPHCKPPSTNLGPGKFWIK